MIKFLLGKNKHSTKLEGEQKNNTHFMPDRDDPYFETRHRSVIGGCFFLYFFAFSGFAYIVLFSPDTIKAIVSVKPASVQRTNITDRNGHILANNIATYALYAYPDRLADPVGTIHMLKHIFPDMKENILQKLLDEKRKFVWLRDEISYAQKQAVHDIGEPGLGYGEREMRFYPNGALAAHILGGSVFSNRDVNFSEIQGVAGLEKYFDKFLRAPNETQQPLVLSIDRTIQDSIENILHGAVRIMETKNIAALLMDIHNGEIIALASLPDFDPNDRMLMDAQKGDEILFNRAVQGVYELGSVFKIFTVAQALELGHVTPDTEIDVSKPIRTGGFVIGRDEHYGDSLKVSDIIIRSSNRGAGQLALMNGIEYQRDFLRRLGFFEKTPLELIEARSVRPVYPKKWTRTHSITISYGHGIAVSLVHLASAYASILNGGKIIRPTLLKDNPHPDLGRIISPEVSAQLRDMLRKVVTKGTARRARGGHYEIAGKTGTADKINDKGGYYETRNINSFASIFPADNPLYVLVVMMDEPHYQTGEMIRREAGWTVVPVSGEIIERVAPLLGLKPYIVNNVLKMTQSELK